MLIICNGVFKSGSSWLHAVIVEILRVNNIQLTPVPIKYTNNTASPTTIVESKLYEFLQKEDYISGNYITKSHFYQKKTLERDYNDYIFFFFVERDVRDAVVSHYYHLKAKYMFMRRIGFKLYYYFVGRFKAFEILNFNKRYRDVFDEENFFSFSEMKYNFESVVSQISSILGLKILTKEEISIIKRNTSIPKMRDDLLSGKSKYYSTVFYDKDSLIRKGEIGNWVNYFSCRQKKHISKIVEGRNLFFLKIFYFILFTLRRRFFRIE